MDASEQLKQGLREGRIDVERLVALVTTLQRQVQTLQQQLQAANQQPPAANQRIEALQKRSGGAGGPKVDQP